MNGKRAEKIKTRSLDPTKHETYLQFYFPPYNPASNLICWGKKVVLISIQPESQLKSILRVGKPRK